MISRLRRGLLMVTVISALLAAGAGTALAGKGGVPNERSCGGIGRGAQGFAALPGPMDPGVMFAAYSPFTCDDVGEEHGQGF